MNKTIKYTTTDLGFMSVVFYRGERYFVEKADLPWVRITSRPLRKDPFEWPDERESFAVFADVLELAPPVANIHTAQRLPTVASTERAARAKTGVRDVGDEVAVLLRACATLDAVYKAAAKYVGVPESDLRKRYGHLNHGQQRMNCGNKMRHHMKKGLK